MLKEVLKNIVLKFAEIIVPLERLITVFSKPECITTTEQYVDLMCKIKEGDILFSRVYYELSNGIEIGGKYYLGIPGPYKHVAVYIDGMVYEAVTAGVRCVSLAEWFFKKDCVGVARCSAFNNNSDKRAAGLEFLKSCIGDQYQYDFVQFSRKKYFCSAYWYSYMQAMQGDDFNNWFKIPMLLGLVPYLTPNDIWNKLDKVVQYNE